MGFKMRVRLSMITINLDATATAIAIAKQLNCDRTSVYRVLRWLKVFLLIGIVIVITFGYFVSKRNDRDD